MYYWMTDFGENSHLTDTMMGIRLSPFLSPDDFYFSYSFFVFIQKISMTPL